jgi:hypothetical protein
MCCCGRPTINGEPGAYSWDGKSRMTYTPNPPALQDGDVLIYDEPGRCGGIDSHAFHFRLVKRHGDVALLVRHGMGDEGFPIRRLGKLLPFDTLDSNGRYWIMQALYHTLDDAKSGAAETAEHKWRVAAVEKRIRTRKQRGRGMVKVWIEPPSLPAPSPHAAAMRATMTKLGFGATAGG